MSEKRKTIRIRGSKLLHFAVSMGLFMAAWLLYKQQYHIRIPDRYNLFVYTMYAFCLLFFLRTYNAYMTEYASVWDLTFAQGLSDLFSVCITYAITLLAWNKFHAPWLFLILLAVQFLFNYLWSFLASRGFDQMMKPLRTVVVFRNEDDLARIREMGRFEKRFAVDKYIENPTDLDRVLEEIEDYEAVFLAGVNATLRNGIAKFCVERNIQGMFIPHVGDILMAGAQHIQSFHTPVLSVRRAAPKLEYLVVKRLLDILLSSLAIVVLSPFMLITALAIRLYDGGPAIYKQVRLTKDGKEFPILKFRSMRMDAERDGVARLASTNDSRITPVGKVLRAIRFDELPQLFNILKGDMSIVGPRPERPEIAARYERELPVFNLRLQVKAGLTGYAQVYGKYNTDPYDKLEMDLLYINKMSLITDLQLMFATVRILFAKESTEGIENGCYTAEKVRK